MAATGRSVMMSFECLAALYMPYTARADSTRPEPFHAQSEAKPDEKPSSRPFSIIHKHVDKSGQVLYLVQKNGDTIENASWEVAEDVSEEDIKEYEGSVRSDSESRSDDDDNTEQPEAQSEDDKPIELLTYLDHFGGVPPIKVEFREIQWRRLSDLSIPEPSFLDCKPVVSPTSCRPLKRRKIRLDSKQSETIAWAQ